MSLTIGIDVGGTKVLGGVVDAEGNVLKTARRDTPQEGGLALTRTIADVALELIAEYSVTCVGVSVAGFVSSDRKTILATPNIVGWNGVQLDQELTALIKIPVVLENDGNARQLARYIKEVGERYVENLEIVMVYRNDRFLRGGDHTPYVQRGFAAVRFTEMNENYYHQHQDVRVENNIQYGDLPEFMDFEYLRKNTAVNLANLANLAKAPSKPEEVKVEVKKLSNSTSLQWKAPKTGKTKGYYVLIRETTSAVWQKKFFTENTEIKLPFSKDNYFFAVQSITESGNESLPVVPLPAR